LGDVFIVTNPEGHSHLFVDVGSHDEPGFRRYNSILIDIELNPEESVDWWEFQQKLETERDDEQELPERLALFNMSLQYTSDNFYWYSTNENAQWLPLMAEGLEDRFSELFDIFELDSNESSGRITILYFTNQGLTDWVNNYFPPGHMWIGTEFTNYMGFGGPRVYITRPAGSTTPSENMMSLLVHEVVHAIQYIIAEGNTYAIPVWLMEGTAVYFEGRSGGYFDDILSMGVRNNNIRTLSYLDEIAWDTGSFAWDVWGAAMVQFIHQTFGFEYVIELHQNYDIETVFGISRAEFERQWHQWLRDNYG
jgi:hypothetical protein